MPSIPTNILLLTTIESGVLLSVSPNSWFSAWIGLEVNLISFIPLISIINNIYNTEASLNYFIVQVLASATPIILVSIKASTEGLFTHTETYSTSMLICTPLLLMGVAARIQWCFTGVIEGISWENFTLLITVQNVAPLILLSYSIGSNIFTTIVILSSVIIGAIGGLNQTSLRNILTYSTFNHTGWILTAIATGESMWVL